MLDPGKTGMRDRHPTPDAGRSQRFAVHQRPVDGLRRQAIDGLRHIGEILQETLRRDCVLGGGNSLVYCRWSGTSFAAPHVVATAALLLEEHPGASRDQVRRAIEESALDRGAPCFDPLYGHGVVQANAALGRLDEIVASEGEGCVATPERLCLLGNRFEFLEHRRETHRTPSGTPQAFTWITARRTALR